MVTMMLMLMMLMVMLVIMVVGGIPVTVSVSQSLSEAAEANFPPLYFSYLFSATFHICSLQDKYIFKPSRLGQSSRAGVVNPFQRRKKSEKNLSQLSPGQPFIFLKIYLS